jgi:hypothetical protein
MLNERVIFTLPVIQFISFRLLSDFFGIRKNVNRLLCSNHSARSAA